MLDIFRFLCKNVAEPVLLTKNTKTTTMKKFLLLLVTVVSSTTSFSQSWDWDTLRTKDKGDLLVREEFPGRLVIHQSSVKDLRFPVLVTTLRGDTLEYLSDISSTMDGYIIFSLEKSEDDYRFSVHDMGGYRTAWFVNSYHPQKGFKSGGSKVRARSEEVYIIDMRKPLKWEKTPVTLPPLGYDTLDIEYAWGDEHEGTYLPYMCQSVDQDGRTHLKEVYFLQRGIRPGEGHSVVSVTVRATPFQVLPGERHYRIRLLMINGEMKDMRVIVQTDIP
jgi:hypothetical protein